MSLYVPPFGYFVRIRPFLPAFQPAEASPKYASIVVDAHSGRVLQYYRDEQMRFPASLTKIMTVYVALEEIRAGRMEPDTPIACPPMPPSNQPASWACAQGKPFPPALLSSPDCKIGQ